MLLTFGLASFASIAITGMWIDRRHRHLTVTSMVLVGTGSLAPRLAAQPALVYIAAVVWGLGSGGGAMLFITAGIRAVGDAIVAIMIPTAITAIVARRHAFPHWTATGPNEET